jgi:hypothetical protein
MPEPAREANQRRPVFQDPLPKGEETLSEVQTLLRNTARSLASTKPQMQWLIGFIDDDSARARLSSQSASIEPWVEILNQDLTELCQPASLDISRTAICDNAIRMVANERLASL